MVPFLSFKNVSLSFHTELKETEVLSDLSFDIHQGEFVAFVGPSGCGKSTILNLISGLLKPEQGEILLKGIPIENTSDSIGYMLQKDHLFQWRTILGNIMLGPEINHQKTPEKLAYARKLLSDYGLSDFENARPSQLSGGMRQRAALIRTLVMEPSLLLLDEPFSALDYQTRLNVSDDIGKIIKKHSITAILVTHDIAEAISMADRVFILSNRPTRIHMALPIQLTVENRTPLNSRSAPEFHKYFDQIWKELNVS